MTRLDSPEANAYAIILQSSVSILITEEHSQKRRKLKSKLIRKTRRMPQAVCVRKKIIGNFSLVI